MYGNAKFDKVMLNEEALSSYTHVASCYTVIRIGLRRKEIRYQNKERLQGEENLIYILHLLFNVQFQSLNEI